MSIYDTTQIALERAMSGAELRQEAIANNLANVNTPGYRREDVDFHDALRAAMATGDPAQATFQIAKDTSGPVNADGNGVDPDVENAQMARNGLEQEALAAVAKTRLSIVEQAIGGKG
jgi:flagellar basal-body rod protein FlgB